MKNSILKIKGINILKKAAQRNITGGALWACHCGFEEATIESPGRMLKDDTLIGALQRMGAICEGQGANCRSI